MTFVPIKSHKDFKNGSLYRYVSDVSHLGLCIYSSLEDYDYYAMSSYCDIGQIFMVIDVASSPTLPSKILTSDGVIGYASLFYKGCQKAIKY